MPKKKILPAAPVFFEGATQVIERARPFVARAGFGLLLFGNII